MRAITTVSILCLAVACNRDDDLAPVGALEDAPPCVQEFVGSINSIDRIYPPWYVRAQRIGAETHYWLDTGAPAWDGIDRVVDGNCNEVCSFGGFRLALACEADYDTKAWIEIWKG